MCRRVIVFYRRMGVCFSNGLFFIVYKTIGV